MAHNVAAGYKSPATDKPLHTSSNIGKIVKVSLLAIAVAGVCFVLFDYETGSAYGSQLLTAAFFPKRVQNNCTIASTDVDIMWFRNPFLRFFPDADFQIACDQFIGDTLNKRNNPNGGFIYALSNNRTIQFYKFWLDSRRTYPRLNEQEILNRIKFHPYLRQIGLRMRFLDTVYFGGFCQPSKELTKVCTMHANCCVGLENKIHDLSLLLEDWKRFLSLPLNLQRSELFRWSVPKKCKMTST